MLASPPATRLTLAIPCPHTALCCMLASCPVRLSAHMPSCQKIDYITRNVLSTHCFVLHACRLPCTSECSHPLLPLVVRDPQPCRRAYSGKAIVSLFYLFLLFLQKEHSHVTELTAVRPLCHFFYRFHFFRKRNTAMSQSLKR